MNALIVVDAQYDFMPGGALAVAEGDKIAEVISKVLGKFDYVVFTQDWHPENHCSFKTNGGIWPVHCVEGSHGAEIEQRIYKQGDKVIQKGVHQDVDSYSGFWDNEKKHQTGLHEYLIGNKVDTVYICGLATDYCVKFTAIDATDLGYNVYLVADACRGVDVKPGDSQEALIVMEEKGVRVVTHDALI